MLGQTNKNKSPASSRLKKPGPDQIRTQSRVTVILKLFFLFFGGGPVFLIPIRMFRTSRVGPIFEIRVFRINIMCLRYRNEIRHRNINSKWISSFTINVIGASLPEPIAMRQHSFASCLGKCTSVRFF